VVVIGQFDIGGHAAGFQSLWANPGGFWPAKGDSTPFRMCGGRSHGQCTFRPVL